VAALLTCCECIGHEQVSSLGYEVELVTVDKHYRYNLIAWIGTAILICALALTGCSGTSGGAIAPTPEPPHPNIQSLIPTTAQVTGERFVQLTNTGPHQVVITYVSEQQGSSGLTSRDLVILSWDQYAKRWVNVFDGSKAQSPQAVGPASPDNAMLPSTGSVSDLGYSTIVSTRGRTDLAFWASVNFGANGGVVVGIVHYDGQVASLAYSADLPDAPGAPSVTGSAPHQKLSIPGAWLTVDDPECCPVRNYIETVGWGAQPSSGSTPVSDSYIVEAST